jgi:hypothetical protein
MRRIFILGVGAQKSGTTWLSAYIRRDKRANLGDCKEYHVWDALYSSSDEERARFRVRKRHLFRALARGRFRVPLIQYRMQSKEGYYEDYFRAIFDRGFQITGDITPSYAALTSDQMGLVRKKILDTGAEIKVVFLMRDPVERCWSAVRMMKKVRETRLSDVDALKSLYATDRFQLRTRYEVTCENLLKAFKREELYFGLYESMFEPSNMRALSEFLLLPVDMSFIQHKENASPKAEVIPEDLRQEIKRFYSDTYDYCFSRFPEARVYWENGNTA